MISPDELMSSTIKLVNLRISITTKRRLSAKEEGNGKITTD